MARLCHAQGDWVKLNSTILTISKRHQQSRHAVAVVLEQGIGWVEATPDTATKVALIACLRDVTDGKIYAEAERAKLTRALAVIKEAEGDIAGACDAMLDVYVETFGALSKREKIDFILEQIRLCILKQDWVRVMIVAKKVQTKFLEEPDMQDLKLRYYGLLCDYHLREKDAFALAQVKVAPRELSGACISRARFFSLSLSLSLPLSLSFARTHARAVSVSVARIGTGPGLLLGWLEDGRVACEANAPPSHSHLTLDIFFS